MKDGEAELPPLVATAHTESDSELGIGLKWNTPPCTECSRLDDWFLGMVLGSQTCFAQPDDVHLGVPEVPSLAKQVAQRWRELL